VFLFPSRRFLKKEVITRRLDIPKEEAQAMTPELDKSIRETTLKEIMEYFAIKYAALIMDVTDLEKLTVGRIVELAQELHNRSRDFSPSVPASEWHREIQLRLTRVRNRL
jgi:hypothetical protein